tara:strand:- start:956 stop:2323 length:1368 start_codon:yes stop_codon:yes gene_type:complete
MTKKNIILNELKKNFLLYLFFLSVFLSLDTNFDNIKNIDITNSKSIFLGIRFILPYCLLIFFIKKYFNKLNFRHDDVYVKILLNLLFFSQFLQIISTTLSDNNLFNLTFIFSFIMIILSIIVFDNINSLDKLYVFGLIILTIITLIYSYILIKWLIFDSFHLNLYGSWPHGTEAGRIFSNEVPRSSGLARSSLLSLIPLSFFLLTTRIYKITYLILYLVFLVLVFIILTTQSRVVLFCYGLGSLTLIIYSFQHFIQIKKKIAQIFLLIFLPIIIWYSIIEIKYYLQLETEIILTNKEKTEVSGYSGREMTEKLRTVDPKSFTSRRFIDWKDILDKNDRKFFGYGALGDRYLINQSASSTFFYSYASGGIISLLIFILLILRSIFVNFQIVFKIEKKISDKNYMILSASFIQIFLIFRCFFESSFAVFGIDSIFFFITFFYSEKYYQKIIYDKKII